MDGFEGGGFVDGDVAAHAEDPLEDVEKGFVSGGTDGEGDLKTAASLSDDLLRMEGAVGEEFGHGRADVEAEGDHVGALAKSTETALHDGFGIEIGVRFEVVFAEGCGMNAVQLELADFAGSVIAGEEIPVALHVEDVVGINKALAGAGGPETGIFNLYGALFAGGVEKGIPNFRADGENRGRSEAEDPPVGVVVVNGDVVFEFSGDLVEDALKGFLDRGAPVLGDGLAGDEQCEEFAFGEGHLREKPTGFGQIVAVVFPIVGDGGAHAVTQAVENAGDGAGTDFELFRNTPSTRAAVFFQPLGESEKVGVV